MPVTEHGHYNLILGINMNNDIIFDVETTTSNKGNPFDKTNKLVMLGLKTKEGYVFCSGDLFYDTNVDYTISVISFFNKISNKVDNYESSLSYEIEIYINFVEQNWIKDDNFRYGIVHADLFPDNVFFDQNNNLSGVIDFYFAASDLFIYDLAIIINAWCFNENNYFSVEKYDIILQEYQKYQRFSAVELNFLKIALVGASLRFLLTRLYDLFFTPADSLVKIKNPQEYLQKIRYFYEHKNIKYS